MLYIASGNNKTHVTHICWAENDLTISWLLLVHENKKRFDFKNCIILVFLWRGPYGLLNI